MSVAYVVLFLSILSIAIWLGIGMNEAATEKECNGMGKTYIHNKWYECKPL